jgi:hypothetical protein
MAVGLPVADRRGTGGRPTGCRGLAEDALEDGCGLARGRPKGHQRTVLAAADWPMAPWRMIVGLPVIDRRGIGGRFIWLPLIDRRRLLAGRSARAARVACDVACECRARPWRGTEAQEGIGHCQGCNSPVMVRIHRRSKALEAAKAREARFDVRRWAPRIDNMLVRWRNVTRAIQRRRAGGPGGEGKPLESETPWAFPA